MRAFDLSPFMHSAIGFDDLFGLADNLGRTAAKAPSFPPYDIEKLNEDNYRITMALAGFTDDDLNVTVEDDTLIIEGSAGTTDEDEGRNFLHKGIAKRAFERRFQLADAIKVGAAHFEHGLLSIELQRIIPEHKKPRKVSINNGAPPQIEGKAS